MLYWPSTYSGSSPVPSQGKQRLMRYDALPWNLGAEPLSAWAGEPPYECLTMSCAPPR